MLWKKKVIAILDHFSLAYKDILYFPFFVNQVSDIKIVSYFLIVHKFRISYLKHSHDFDFCLAYLLLGPCDL